MVEKRAPKINHRAWAVFSKVNFGHTIYYVTGRHSSIQQYHGVVSPQLEGEGGLFCLLARLTIEDLVKCPSCVDKFEESLGQFRRYRCGQSWIGKRWAFGALTVLSLFVAKIAKTLVVEIALGKALP